MSRQHAYNDDDGTPADQPKPPVGSEKCDPIPDTCPPTWTKPTPCETDPYCECPPGGPGSDPNCLETLITDKAKALAAAEKDAVFKKALEDLLKLANDAKKTYTRDVYNDLVKQWVEQDKRIVRIISNLVCNLPCWRCVIECYVCPLINVMHDAEERLKWEPMNYPKAFNRYDLLNWYTRDREVKERRFKRIQSVLGAWKDPAKTIKDALTANAKLMDEIDKPTTPDAGKVAFDVFLKLVPLHLAIAPPQGTKWQTKIGKQYTEFCSCDANPDPDDCCGPDVGKIEWSLRQRLVGPQPYLIDPNQYLPLICCLVEKRYGPAQEQLTKVEGELLKIEAEIKQDNDLVVNGLKSFDKDARAAIPGGILCYGDQLPKPEQDETQTS